MDWTVTGSFCWLSGRPQYSRPEWTMTALAVVRSTPGNWLSGTEIVPGPARVIGVERFASMPSFTRASRIWTTIFVPGRTWVICSVRLCASAGMPRGLSVCLLYIVCGHSRGDWELPVQRWLPVGTGVVGCPGVGPGVICVGGPGGT